MKEASAIIKLKVFSEYKDPIDFAEIASFIKSALETGVDVYSIEILMERQDDDANRT